MWFEDAEEYKWHYDYSRLACDSGFTFGKLKKSMSDKKKFYFIDIEQIIRERDLSALESYISFVYEYKLDDEQAEVLDKNFVKMFKISQLSVEYLLFCRMYLDHSVINQKQEITKLKQENNELKTFVEELEKHISVLTDKLNNQTNIVAYKCDKCMKVFSSEVFLNAHQQRRHNNNILEENDTYTNQLQSEIKELKERLNNTEKLIQDQTQLPVLEKQLNINNNNDVENINEKFREFKAQIETELKTLETQKSFYEDKYLKLFEIASKQLLNNEESHKVKKTIQNGTQTDLQQKNLKTELTHNKNVFVYKEMSEETHSEDENNLVKTEEIIKNESNVSIPNIEEKLIKFEENIENKVSTAFNNIETKMQTFWDQLQEIQQIAATKKVKEEKKPVIKPRTRLTKPKQVVKNIVQTDIVKEVAPDINSRSVMYDFSESDNSFSHSKENVIENKVDVKSINEPLNNRSLQKVVNNEDKLFNYRKHVENTIKTSLQEFGISYEWKQLPKRTFDHTLEIIKHQINNTKKNYKNYSSIRRQIERKLDLRIKKSPKRKHLKKQEKPLLKATINPTLYETDSDSVQEVGNKGIKANVPQFAPVINELKAKLKTPSKVTETKSVLKNYPSTSSLVSKKKVFFDLESSSSGKSDGDFKAGSTTSLGSSLLDRNGTQERGKDVENLSDFDFNDM